MSNPIIVPTENFLTGPSNPETNSKGFNKSPENPSFMNVLSSVTRVPPKGTQATDASQSGSDSDADVLSGTGQRQESADNTAGAQAVTLNPNLAALLASLTGRKTSSTSPALGVALNGVAPTPSADTPNPSEIESVNSLPPPPALPVSLQGIQLKQLPIGPRLTVVTTDRPSPDDATLRDFAKKQGLDEAAIGWLLSGGPMPNMASKLETLKPLPNSLTIGSPVPPASIPPGLSLTLPASTLPASTLPASTLDAMHASTTVSEVTTGIVDPAASSLLQAQAAVPPVTGVPLNPGLGSRSNEGTPVGWMLSAPALGQSPFVELGGQAVGQNIDNAVKPGRLVDLDLTQDSNIDWKTALKGVITPLNDDRLSGAPININDLASALGDDRHDMTLSPDSGTDLGSGHDGASAQAFQAPQPRMDFKSELNAMKDGLASPSMTMTGQDLADKMSEAIGKRLLDAVSKGDWQLKINLKPVELGHIEVDLRMKGNALEAQFTAHQGMTKDLLESGLGRLKETLQNSGTDVAFIRINDGQSSRSGGDSTPRHAPQGSQAAMPQKGLSTETSVTPTAQTRSNSDGGLDLMV